MKSDIASKHEISVFDLCTLEPLDAEESILKGQKKAKKAVS